jgi:excisionase family DNA binding protein
MSPDQAAARMHISRSTYFRMVKEGKIHPRKIGAQKTLVSRQEIDNLLSGQQISDSPSQ